MKLRKSYFLLLLLLVTFPPVSVALNFTKDDLELVKGACLAGSSFEFTTEADGSLSVKNLDGKGKLHVSKESVDTVDLPSTEKKQEFDDIRTCIKEYLLTNKGTGVTKSEKSCTQRWQECHGFENLAGLWRGTIPSDTPLSVSIEAQDTEDVFATMAIENSSCKVNLKLVSVDEFLSTSDFFFKPTTVTPGCPELEAVGMRSPSPTSSWMQLKYPDGKQVTITVNKKI